MPPTTAQNERRPNRASGARSQDSRSRSGSQKRIQHRRINPIALYLTVLAVTFFGYVLYDKYAVPIIEGPPNVVVRRPITEYANASRPIEDRSEVAHLFPPDAWEHGPCKTLETSAGTLLFQDFKPQDDGFVDVFPFTLILDRGENGSKASDATASEQPQPPTLLRCLTGARLKFDKPITLGGMGNDGAPNRLIAGRLVGQVTIKKEPTGKYAEDGLAITTSNVQIDVDQIYTLEDVDFVFGRNRGRGRNLKIDLTHDQHVNNITRDFSNIEGIERVELAFLKELRINPPPNRRAPDTFGNNLPVERSSKSPLLSGNDTPLDISCEGAFVFDFKARMATFKKNVSVQQVDNYGDNIQCEALTLVFFDEESTNSPVQSELNSIQQQQEQTGNLKIKRIVAEGKPAVLVANSQQAKVTADFLGYNLLDGTVTAHSEHSVTILNKQLQLDAKKLNYVMKKDGGIGDLVAVGPGRMLRLGKDASDEFYTSWRNRLIVRDDETMPARKLLMIDEKAKVRIGQTSEIDADNLKFWFYEKQADEKVVGQIVPEKKAPGMIPARMHAVGNVKIKSPTLSGQALDLVATWPEPNPDDLKKKRSSISIPSNHSIASRPLLSSRTLLAGSESYSPQIQMVAVQPTTLRQEGNRAGQTSDNSFSNQLRQLPIRDTQVDPAIRKLPVLNSKMIAPVRRDAQLSMVAYNEAVNEKRHLDFVGQRIRMKFDSLDPEAQPADIEIDGNVEIKETKVSRPGQRPLKIVGERLRFVAQGPELYQMSVAGSGTAQALVIANDMQLVGENIFMNQLENKMWVEGAGRIKMRPSKKKPTSPQTAAKPGPLASTPQELDVSWGAGMIFDGSEIYFEQDVIMTTKRSSAKPLGDSRTNPNNSPIKAVSGTTETKTLSQGLSVYLSKAVNFQQLSGQGDIGDIEINRVALVDSLTGRPKVFSNASFAAGEGEAKVQPIIVENRSYDQQGRMTGSQKLIVPKASVDGRTGDIFAAGPGKIISHRQGGASLGAAMGASPTAARQPMSKQGLSALQVNFDGTLNGNTNYNNIEIVGNVRVINVPVKNWEQAMDPDLTKRIPAGGVKLTCDKITISQWQPKASVEPTNEMVATGNAHIWGDLYEAIADRVSYNQANDMLTIEGTARSDAKLWYQTAPGAERSPLVAGKLLYRPSDQRIKIQRVKSATINQKGKMFGGQR